MSTAARIEELRKKFEENPRRYFAPLANELRKAGDLTQAIALCREHLPKQPGHMSGYIVFGQALYESAALDEARAVFEQALGLDPENLIALHHLGHIARQQGDTVGARRWYERALETDPRNDDIAHQLATLATPVRPPAAVPPPALTDAPPAPQPVPQPEPEPPSEARSSAVPTPAYALDFLGSLPLDPTPDASMRAIDFDTVNASLQQAAAPLVPEAEAFDSFGDSVGEPLADEAATVEAMTDETATIEAVPVTDAPTTRLAPIDLEDAFEEGLIADGWPDPAELAERLATPRTVTPLAVDVTPEAAEAFGLEAGDRVPVSAPEPELEVLDAEADLLPSVTRESSDVAVSESEASPVSIGDADGDESAVDVAGVAAAETPAEAFDLPWLAAPEPEAREEPTVVAPSVGSAWTPAAVPIVDEEASFADVHPFEASGAADGELGAPIDEPTEWAGRDDVFARVGVDQELAVDESAAFDEPVAMAPAEALPAVGVAAEELAGEEVPEVPAFVTETMGELLVAQGFIDRAVTVYDELVRRRPYDPLLSARLAELREQAMAAPPAPVFTARERFAALAARRVVRRTPARPGAPIAGTPMAGMPVAGVSEVVPAMPTPERAVSDVRVSGRVDSLAELFGQATAAPDDVAAQALADAFAPVPLRLSSPAEFAAALRETERADRPATPAYGAVRQPTPASLAAVPVVPPQPAAPDPRPVVDSAADFSFDRFFPDPASSAAAGTSSSRAMPPAAPPAAPPAVPSDDTNEHSATDDLAQFSAWLKGLGKS